MASRPLIVAAVAALSTWSSAAHAQSAAASSAVTAGAIAGAAAGNGAGHAVAGRALPLIGTSPEGFRNPTTGAASRLFSGCDHIGQIVLSIDPNTAWLTLFLVNAGEDPALIRPERATVAFDTGVTRTLLPDPPRSISLRPGWWYAVRLVLPDKADLEGAHRLSITVPVKAGGATCTIQTELLRNDASPQPAEDYTQYTAFDLAMGAGPRLFLSGGMKRLGSYEPTIELSFSAFASLHHGFFFDMLLEPHGHDGVKTALGYAPTVSPTVVTGGAFSAGYQYRALLRPWLPLVYGVGPSYYLASVVLPDSAGKGPSGGAFAVAQRLRMDALLPPMSNGARFGLGLTAYHEWITGGRLGHASLAGSTGGLLLHLTLAQ